ncbi:MAG: response regulator [Rhodanobacteraceae bacterium]|nr:response regulator [Rhodanobacteraceae bacterium]
MNPMPMRVLIIEDEPKLAALLTDYLQRDGYVCTSVHDGGAAIDQIRAIDPAIVLLDLMLPNKDGYAICRELRAFSTVPVLMLTARVDEIDRLLGLELGADDYLCKPYSPREVVARVRALLRRTRQWSALPAHTDPLQLDHDRFEARIDGHALALTPVEFRLLAKLRDKPGHVLSRAQLLDAIYVDHRVVSDRTVDSHIKNLRKKLTDTKPGFDPVSSVYGIGYRYEV